MENTPQNEKPPVSASQGGGDNRPPQKRRHSSVVPPLDAFDNIPRRPPPEHLDNIGLPHSWQRQKQQDTAESSAEEETGKAKKHKKKKAKKDKVKKDKAKHAASLPEKKKQKEKHPLAEKKQRGYHNPVKQRFRRRVAAVLLVIALIAAGCVITVNTLFKIEDFAIEGEIPYTEAEIAAVFGHLPGESMFSFKAKEIEERICAALPYIESVEVRRRFPSTVVFKVEQAQESYYIPWENGFAILSASQKVLRFYEPEPVGIVRIEGITEANVVPGYPIEITDPATKELLGTLLTLLKQQEIEGINWLDVSSPAGIQFRWQGRFTIILGGRSNLPEKLTYAMQILTDTQQSGLTENDRGVLDVSSYPTVPRAVYTPESSAPALPAEPEPPPEEDTSEQQDGEPPPEE